MLLHAVSSGVCVWFCFAFYFVFLVCLSVGSTAGLDRKSGCKARLGPGLADPVAADLPAIPGD